MKPFTSFDTGARYANPGRLFAAFLFAILLFIGGASCFAQSNTTISGTLEIRFDTRTKAGPRDKYALNLNVCDSALFRGGIEYLPFVIGTVRDTPGALDYDLSCDVVNPKNRAQTANVGKLFGTVPVDGKNVYHFSDGSLQMRILPRGTSKGFDSKVTGLALGKPPQNNSTFTRMKQEAISFSKSVKGKVATVIVSKYDKMEFRSHVLAAGPVQVYPEVTVNGGMLYDYARSAWYFRDVTASYAVDGRQLMDKITGTVRWVEAPDRKKSGRGQYEFDIRFNEPAASEGTVFATAQDESAIFDTDTSIPSLTGTMKYVDTMSGDSVIASSVAIDLVGNNLTKQQAMLMAKLLLSAIVPLNAE